LEQGFVLKEPVTTNLTYIVATVVLLFIPKNRIRLAIFALLCKQVITFFIGLVVVELGLLEYPVRCFESVNRTSFYMNIMPIQLYVPPLMHGIQIIKVFFSDLVIMLDFVLC
jgi:hypothetical protein